MARARLGEAVSHKDARAHQAQSAGRWIKSMVGGQVGRSLPRIEARDKITGRAEYTHTLRLPGMLYGKIFRSTLAHGRIGSIDTGAAKKFPGVYRVVIASTSS